MLVCIYGSAGFDIEESYFGILDTTKIKDRNTDKLIDYIDEYSASWVSKILKTQNILGVELDKNNEPFINDVMYEYETAMYGLDCYCDRRSKYLVLHNQTEIYLVDLDTDTLFSTAPLIKKLQVSSVDVGNHQLRVYYNVNKNIDQQGIADYTITDKGLFLVDEKLTLFSSNKLDKTTKEVDFPVSLEYAESLALKIGLKNPKINDYSYTYCVFDDKMAVRVEDDDETSHNDYLILKDAVYEVKVYEEPRCVYRKVG
jgi:hypothetical protein